MTVLQNLNPISGGIFIAPDTNVYLEIYDVDGISASSVSLYIDKNDGIGEREVYNASGGGWQATYTGTVATPDAGDTYQYTVNPDVDFSESSLVTVRITGLNSLGVLFNLTYSFTIFPETMYVGAQDPAQAETDVSINTAIDFSVIDDTYSLNASSLEFTVDSALAYDADGGGWQSGFSGSLTFVTSGYDVSIYPASSFGYDQDIDINVYATNTVSGILDYSWFFRTIANDTISLTGQDPANGAVEIAVDDTVQFHLEDSSHNILTSGVVVCIDDDVAYNNGDQPGFTSTVTSDGDGGYYFDLDPTADFSEDKRVIVSVSALNDMGGTYSGVYYFDTERSGLNGVEYDTDFVLYVNRTSTNTDIGSRSPYVTTPHPGSNILLDGWKWDRSAWATKADLDSMAISPTIWDGTASGLNETFFQSGYGDNLDLLLLDIVPINYDGEDIWAPKIYRGNFYIYDEPWYLYSDWGQAEFFTATGIAGGRQVIDLQYDVEPVAPIRIQRYQFDRSTNRHLIDKDFRKVLEFTVSGQEEFMVDEDITDRIRIWLNGEFHEDIGNDVSFVSSGVANPDNVASLEHVGISTGQPDQVFNLEYSPVDRSQTVQVWTYRNMLDLQEWTVLSGIDQLTSGEYYDVLLDNDLGTLTFGNYNGTSGYGVIPGSGVNVVARYTAGLATLYEPDHTLDYILATQADTNPLGGAIQKGFIQVGTTEQDVSYIRLTSSLTLDGNYYLIDLGNNTGRMYATVYDNLGQLIEGISVNFEILDYQLGTFGNETNVVSAITNSAGRATSIYSAPTLVEQLGQYSNTPTIGSGKTVFDISDITNPGDPDEIYIYKVFSYDNFLGVPEASVSGIYQNFLNEENIVAGATATVDWETIRRSVYDVGQAETYSAGDIETGKKCIILTNNLSDSINPHTGLYDLSTLVPLHPLSISDIGSLESPRLLITFPLELDDIGYDNTKSYLLVGNGVTRIRAYADNPRTGYRVYSNTINVKITISDEANGTYYAESLATVTSGLLTSTRNVYDISDANINLTSGINNNYDDYLDAGLDGESYADWFRRTQQGNTVGFEDYADTIAGFNPGLLVTELQSAPGHIPLGFRLKSTGITVASMLDQVTYLDPNDHLPDDYWPTISGYWEG